MKESEELNIVARELSMYGIKPQVEPTEAGHVRVRWSVKGKHRTMICGQNKSDNHAALNNRALVRRWLREDGAAKIEHKQKILAPPEATNSLQDRVTRLESEIECLLDIVADLAARIGQPITVNVLTPPRPRKWTNGKTHRIKAP